MRIVSTLAAAALAIGLAPLSLHAAPRTEGDVRFIEGNVAGIQPNNTGSVNYGGTDSLQLKAGLATVAVPYAGISKASLSVEQRSADAPLYKVWAHFGKSESRLLSMDFKDETGENKSVTLEVGATTGSAVLNAIKLHNPAVEIASVTSGGKKGSPVPKGALALVPGDSTGSQSSDAAPSPAREKKVKKSKVKPEETKAEETKPTEPQGKEDWWGDRYWKTSRNSGNWGKTQQ